MRQVGFLLYLLGTNINTLIIYNKIIISKTSLDITYYFWDMLINEGDKLFILFFIVSFLDKNSDVSK